MCELRITVIRLFNRGLLLSLIFLLTAQVASAQQTAPMSPSTVLVLKLVSATHVKPVTGIVVSADGLVLVPADFVAEDGEIVVLDGGTDILSNGRPATIVNHSIPGGLALLSVKGLKRPGFTLSENVAYGVTELHLAGFPPAEYIAKGAQPLWVPVTVLLDELNRQLSVSPLTPLPYVTGPLIDECGYLAGLSLTSGAQSLEPGNHPAVIFGDDLRLILAAVQIDLPVASCGQTEIEPAGATVADEPVLKTIETEPLTTETREAPASEPPVETLVDAEQDITVKPDKLTGTTTPERPSLWRSIPPWLPVLGFIILGMLVWKGIVFFRLSRSKAGQEVSAHPENSHLKASDEPDTAQLQAGDDASAPKPRSVPLLETDTPDLDALPRGCNGVVVIDGLFDAETSFKRFCAVDTENINVVIGRGEADISIEYPAISRAHARIENDAGLITLSDLGSSNGTFINGVPCLAGEIMFVDAGDEVFLGDIRFNISVLKTGAESS